MTDPANTPQYRAGGEVSPNPTVQLVLGIVCLLCCWPLAIVSIVFAALAMSKRDTDPADASSKAKIAMYCNIAGFVLGILLLILYVVVLGGSLAAAGNAVEGDFDNADFESTETGDPFGTTDFDTTDVEPVEE